MHAQRTHKQIYCKNKVSWFYTWKQRCITGGCDAVNHVCDCHPGWKDLGCELADCPGEPDCTGHGTCDESPSPEPPVCVCDPGWFSTDDNGLTPKDCR